MKKKDWVLALAYIAIYTALLKILAWGLKVAGLFKFQSFWSQFWPETVSAFCISLLIVAVAAVLSVLISIRIEGWLDKNF